MSDTKRYTVTYKVAAAGSKYVYQEDANGHKAGDSHLSSGGHVWYSLSNGGEGQSYGFSSRDEEPFGPGSLTLHDDAAYQETLYEVTLAVSQERYEKLIDFSKDPARYGFDQGTYNLLTNSCVDFAYASLKVLGYNEDDFQGDLLPSSNVDNLHTLFMKHGANIIRDDLRRRGEYYEDQDAQACLWLGNHEQIIRKTLSQSTSAVRVMKFHYPIRRPDKAPFTDANELYKALERETAGHYLLGSHGFWHGGIHITDRSAPHCVLDDPLRCMADGEVVAYRLNDDYRETTFGNGESAKKLKYSNSFCLIRHEYRSAPNPEEGANHGKQNTLNFYSLYMHLLPYHHYRLSPDEKPAPKVTMTVGDFNAYEVAPAPGLKPHCYGQLASGTQLEILGRAQNGDVTYAQGKIITGSVKNGSSSTRGEGDEVWFAYLKNNEPYQNASGQRIWTADALPERVRPCYWQGKVRATALRRLPLHDEPVKQSEGEPAGARIGKGELCVSSVVEFDSRGVVTLEFGGRPQRMAQCTLVSGGCWGPESVPPTFWTVVDDN
ncbi:hypothetical protein NNO07_27920, partial [Pseudomonas resinovorans]|nr:hypothetical protein [Pseudomonas resinovorans]